ncbi:MAG: TonB-dependent receptor [Chitinophagaceae bacterium]|nr:TonB-dependent receptor [Chitinophagaceae bacterium]
MSKWILVLAMALVTGMLKAQVTISGKVLDQKNKAVSGVSVGLRDSYDGATSDSLGNFRFTTSERGKKILEASSIGFRAFELELDIQGSNIQQDIILREEISELKAVVISAGTFEASDRKKATVLNPIDIVTTASGNGDVTGALKSLPGAQQVGESEGLFVRGGTAQETRTYIDGTLVNNFFYSSVPNIAQRGRFSPFIFKGTIFSTGGYSALYGQALSSALILESIDIPEQTSANIGVTMLSLSAGYQHVAKNKQSSFGLNYGYTDLTLAFAIIKQRQEYQQVPVYHNADANFRIRTSKTGILKYYGTFSTNELSFFQPSIDTPGYKSGFGISNLNTYHNLSWRENLGKKWKMHAGISYTYNKDKIRSGLYTMDKEPVVVDGLAFRNFYQERLGNYANAKLVLERRLAGLTMIRVGGEYNYSDDRSDYTTWNGIVFPFQAKEHIKAAFAETDIYVTNDLAAKIGGRYEHSSLLNRQSIAPRLSLAYKTGKNGQASVAYGVFYQNPDIRYLTGSADFNFAKATHYIAQYQRVTSLQTFRAEVFYKKYDDLIKTKFNGALEAASGTDGYGDAKGFEFFWRDKQTIKNLDYWISYSYLDTKRDFLNFPSVTQPNFATRHTASLVLKKFVTKLKMNINGAYNFATGRPYYYIMFNPQSGKNEFVDKGQTIDYHNLSFSLNYLPSIGKKDAKMFAVYVLSVSNVFNFYQEYGYEYSYNGYRKQAIVPPSRVFVFLGAFLSFGVDRTDDAINNNL